MIPPVARELTDITTQTQNNHFINLKTKKSIMAVFYRKYQDKRNGSSSFGKWYGRSVMLNVVSTKELAEEIAHATTVTYADVVAVLAETSQALKRHLQNSHKVELDGIGSFKVGLSTSGANTSAEFGAQNVKGFRINYSPEVHFVGNGQVSEKNHRKGTFVKDLLYGVTAKEAPKNAVDVSPAESDNQ